MSQKDKNWGNRCKSTPPLWDAKERVKKVKERIPKGKNSALLIAENDSGFSVHLMCNQPDLRVVCHLPYHPLLQPHPQLRHPHCHPVCHPSHRLGLDRVHCPICFVWCSQPLLWMVSVWEKCHFFAIPAPHRTFPPSAQPRWGHHDPRQPLVCQLILCLCIPENRPEGKSVCAIPVD